MFIKHGDGKIMTVINEDDLTELQKKSVNELFEKIIKQSNDDDTDTSIKKKSGR